MKERPILFSGPMVRAVLNGRKTMTRRIVNYPPFDPTDSGLDICYATGNIKCPYGQAGDRLWVKEGLCRAKVQGEDAWWVSYSSGPENGNNPLVVWNNKSCVEWEWERPSLPSMFMPQWASRITLEVTGVRVERVQQISEADAVSEGISAAECFSNGDGTGDVMGPIWAFQRLWDSINAKRGFGWDANPWVWVISFRRTE